jgi:hypothetical protein
MKIRASQGRAASNSSCDNFVYLLHAFYGILLHPFAKIVASSFKSARTQVEKVYRCVTMCVCVCVIFMLASLVRVPLDTLPGQVFLVHADTACVGTVRGSSQPGWLSR